MLDGHKMPVRWANLVSILSFCVGMCAAQQMRMNAAPSLRLDHAMKMAIVDSAAQQVAMRYLFPDVGRSMAQALKAGMERGAFDEVTDPMDLARQLTAVMQEISHDKHTHIDFNPRMATTLLIEKRAPEDQGTPPLEILMDLRRRNYGFERIERLPGNVGYLNLTQFADVQYGAETAVAAMQFLCNSDAVIIDLRNNGGGDGAMVAFVCSYFFDGAPRLINWSVFRDSTQNVQSWTAAYAPGKHLSDVPVYVLTSSRTFSAAEEFAYDLKNLKRATIVGEVTGGGGHHNDFVSLDSNFVLSVSVGQPVNPVTHTNWEGIGVKPDIEVPAEKALMVAQAEALKKLTAKAANEREKQLYSWVLDGLQADLNPVTLSPSELKRYTGTYGERTITFENGALFYERRGRPKMMMIPMSENLFRFKEVQYFRVRFDTGSEGKIVLKGLYDNGMED